ncbi:acyl-CoA synthetases/AMP-acid ligases II [Exophiala viscosa]|uniref:acyl-CoA synthetases/AMP-acid ligases II n=1 Tax=Exophiala viscosa TaxID=2486360 RepID=UPI002196C586|nr:acyl-CoA synthetases/AMP-acid ligases II [Exophiala viscosa]
MSPHIYRSNYPPLRVPTDSSLSEFLLENNPDDTPRDQVILSDYAEPFNTITYGGLRSTAAQAAAGLKQLFKVNEGDCICIVAENSVNWILLAHAVHWFGGVFSVVSSLATSSELVHYFAIAEPEIVATTPENYGKVMDALQISNECHRSPKCLLIEDGFPNSRYPDHLLQFPRDVVKEGGPLLPPFRLPKDARQVPAAMVFSSGTSGNPKGVLLSHYNLIGNLLSFRATDPLLYNGFQREVFFLPFAHIYGLAVVVLGSAFNGCHVVVMKRFNYTKYVERASEIRATILRMVPSTAVAMAKDANIDKLDLRSVRYIMCGGAPLQAEVVRNLQSRMGDTLVVFQSYGLSEALVSTLKGQFPANKAGSVGKLFAGVQLRVVDDDFVDVTPGTQGECVVMGPSVFMGYAKNKEETAATFKDGWFLTGDVVRVDEDNYIWVTERKKELIKYKGYQVPPAELEGILLSHPEVLDAAVCATWDQTQVTELPTAYVSLQKSVASAEIPYVLREIRKYTEAKISPYKRLRGGVHHLRQIPRGANGKLLRRLLPARLEGEKNKRTPKL